MTTAQSVILALVQGITEFLPISSSGHLTIFQRLFNYPPSLSLDILLNTATLLSVLVYFRSQWKFFSQNFSHILVGSIPAGLVGILFKKQIEVLFSQTKILPYFFLLTSIYLISTKFIKKQNLPLTYSRAFIIGIFQAIAILPAISRSGSTLFSGLLLGLSPTTAFNFSFSLFIPASLGALALGLKDITKETLLLQPSLILAFIITFFVGIAALKLLQKTLISQRFWYFDVYTLTLALVLYFFPLR